MKAVSLLQGVVLAGIVSLFAGCAALAPLASNLTGSAPSSNLEVHTQTTVQLSDANFSTVRTNVVGSSKGFKLLGFITIYPATLDKAMNRLYAAAEAEEGRAQTLTHLMIEHSAVYVVLFSIPKVTARADLVEFEPKRQLERDEPDNEPARALGIKQVARPGP